MSQLSAYHLRRPRLTSRLLGASASASVIVGGGGYGKSALAAEAAELLDVPVISTALESAGVSAALLPHRLRSAAARVGLSDLAALMDRAAPAGPAGVLDALLEALAGSGVMIVVDEVQQAEPEALALLTRLAGQLGADQRLLLIGREAPSGLGSLRRNSAAVWLGTADLAMTTPEVAALCRQGFGLAVSEAEAERLRAATGGWTAAVVLAASQARSADQPLLADSARGASEAQVLAGLVEQMLRGIPEPAGSAVVQAAHLPLLRERIVERATKVPGLLAVISQAGLPLAGERGRLVQAHRSRSAPAGGARPGHDRGADRGGGGLRRGGTPRPRGRPADRSGQSERRGGAAGRDEPARSRAPRTR